MNDCIVVKRTLKAIISFRIRDSCYLKQYVFPWNRAESCLVLFEVPDKEQ